MFVQDGFNHNTDAYMDRLTRYTLRRDGFACYLAKYKGAEVVTKPFVFEGDELRLNFATSAKGYVYITIRDEETGRSATTCELFGDTDNRLVHFEDAAVADFAGKPVTLSFRMRDAKLYAFEFKTAHK